jgi:DNA primase
MSAWVDFHLIKEAVSLATVLEHYQWKSVRSRGAEHLQGCCPIHGGHRTDAFHVDLRKKIFHCFSCQACGSVLDLVAAMEACSIRQAALWLHERYGVRSNEQMERSLRSARSQLVRKKEMVIGPLGFTLRPLDSAHRYLQQRAIDPATATHFGMGYYAGPGLMHQRVAIPIHDERGQLLAYAGRSLDGAHPKYKMPAGFHKSRVLFNLHRASACGQGRAVVVEGFFDCLKVHQAGQPCVVALMGCSLSDDQEKLLVERFRSIVLMLDADAAGRQASRVIADRLNNRLTIELVELATGGQPDQLSGEEIHRALSAAVRRVQSARNTGINNA